MTNLSKNQLKKLDTQYNEEKQKTKSELLELSPDWESIPWHLGFKKKTSRLCSLNLKLIHLDEKADFIIEQLKYAV
jgi:hypothetical protein